MELTDATSLKWIPFMNIKQLKEAVLNRITSRMLRSGVGLGYD